MLGAFLAATTFFGVAAATDRSDDGRFQLIVADGYMFKIDTATGQVWKTDMSQPQADFMKPNLGS